MRARGIARRYLAGACVLLAVALPAWAADVDDGIESVTSEQSVNGVEARLRKALEERGMTLFTVIDHNQGARRAERELPPTRTVIFGDPRVGTPFMQCRGSAALDLPQKMVVRKDGDVTRLEWNDPHYLARRHHLENCDLPLDQVAKALASLAREAAGEP
ncbi:MULTISPECIES: DUF302 domain-containing protein [unclassified Modicisalibacter]|uniref:DUF302 domain-containing protein n=1 Tax=unclassified Modicisalibacter TaxID=2679913 RepID=UPI001CCC17E4